MGEFDTQKLKAIEEGRPAPAGAEYQRGEQYGFDDVRNAVFTRDGYRCVCCGRGVKDGAILHAHHLKYRSLGGTNRMENLVTVCDKCHTPVNHQKGGLLWKLMDKYKVKNFKGATFMTSVRWQMYDELKTMFPDTEIHLTYGSRTKEARRLLGVRYVKHNKIRGNTKTEMFVADNVNMSKDGRVGYGTKNKKLKYCKRIVSGCVQIIDVMKTKEYITN